MRLLQGKIQARNKERKLEEFMERKRLEWKFQTPHFGGAHENLVRSTKLALYRALKEGKKLQLLTIKMTSGLLFQYDENTNFDSTQIIFALIMK